MFGTKKEWLNCLKSVFFASVASLLALFVSSIVVAALLREIQPKWLRDAVTYAITMVIYAVFYYRCHMGRRMKTYGEHTERFDPKREVLAYLRTEGKIMLSIYGILTVVTEISCLVTQNAPQNPVSFVTLFCLGPFMILKIPVLRSILAFTYSAATVCLLALLRGRKIHQEERLART